MGKVARNSIKGYTYQQSVFILFLSIMDSERNISKIEIETLDNTNFDDMYFEYIPDGIQKVLSYHVQAKNYPNTSIEDIEIDNSALIIKRNRNDFNSADNNILIVNTSLISTNDTFMGLACVKKSNIIVIPLTPKQVADEMDGMPDNDARKLQLIHKADDIVENAKFVITIDELPDLIMMSTDLENRLEVRLKFFSKYKVLIIDEVGFLPLDSESSNLLFQLITKRYEKQSTIITTNKSLSR